MKNIILVEGEEDKTFINALILKIGIKKPIFFEVLNGLDGAKLHSKLDSLKTSFPKTPFDKLIIIIDQDTYSKEDRLAFINKILKDTFDIVLLNTSTFISSEIDEIPFQIACYFTNVNGKGELEDLLFHIKAKESPHADCLKNCLINTVSNKEIVKSWVYSYIKYDVSTKKDRKQANTFCTLEYSLKRTPSVWDLDHPILNELKLCLGLFR